MDLEPCSTPAFVVDVDECTDETDNCDANAACTNTDGSFTCACNTGYSGDGTTDGTACTGDIDLPGIACLLAYLAACHILPNCTHLIVAPWAPLNTCLC